MSAKIGAELLKSFSKRRKYLAGISGGRDSVALLYLLHQAGFKNVVVCHLNHRLRGRDSGQDAVFVRRLAGKYGFPCETGAADVRKLSKARKLSIETAARQARLEFFAEAAGRHRCHRVFLAHHADDRVETVLINLCRGAGLSGLSGIQPESRIRVNGKELTLLRPLLEIWRGEIDACIRDAGLQFREDPTNAETDRFTRNQVRHNVLPLLERVFRRDPRQAIFRTAKLAAGEDAALDSVVNDLWPDLIDPGGALKSRGLVLLGEGLQRRVIFRWLQEHTAVPDIGFREVEQIRSILDPSSKTAKINLPGGWHARRSRGRIFVESGSPNS